MKFTTIRVVRATISPFYSNGTSSPWFLLRFLPMKSLSDTRNAFKTRLLILQRSEGREEKERGGGRAARR